MWGKKHQVKAFYSNTLPLQAEIWHLKHTSTAKTTLAAAAAIFLFLSFFFLKKQQLWQKMCRSLSHNTQYSRSEINNLLSAYFYLNKRGRKSDKIWSQHTICMEGMKIFWYNISSVITVHGNTRKEEIVQQIVKVNISYCTALYGRQRAVFCLIKGHKNIQEFYLQQGRIT